MQKRLAAQRMRRASRTTFWCAADLPWPQQAYACFVRSPHAFARVVSVDVTAALSAAGVIGVLTAKDMEGVGGLSRHPPLAGRGGKPLVVPHRPALAAERVMHIGEPMAMVVAETAAEPGCTSQRAACRRNFHRGEIRRPHRGDEPAHGGRLDGAARRHRKL
jgi:CO/xanthine dehydrogenase Mo-binding subunit